MIENIQGKDVLSKQQTQQLDLQALMNTKKMQKSNPYASMPIFDKTEISEEAIELYKKDNEIEYFTELARNEPDVDVDKVSKLKALIDSGNYKIPSNEALADSLLGNGDFKALMGF